MTYPTGYMTKSLYKHIINQLPNKTTIVPFFRGESTLHPRFPQYMRALARFETVQLATNGDNLTLHVRNAILKHLSLIHIS